MKLDDCIDRKSQGWSFLWSKIAGIWKSEENPGGWRKTGVCRKSQEKKEVQKKWRGGGVPTREMLLKVQMR